MSGTWPLVPLREIFEIARGGSPRPIDRFLCDDPEGMPWIMIGDATGKGKYITSTAKRIRQEGVSCSRVVQPGDFLLTNSMSFGHPYIMKITGCIHDGWLLLRPRANNVSPDYFYHMLGSEMLRVEFTKRAAGATVKNLNIHLVEGVEIPLPPLSEQKRIADILDKADSLRQKRKESIAKLDTLLQSVFLDMFGDPVTNPKGWNRALFGDITLIDAQMVDPRKKEYRDILHYGPDRIEKDTGELLPAKTAHEDGLISGKFLCDERHILYSKIRPYLNKVACVTSQCLCSADVYPVRVVEGRLTKEYLWFLLRSKAFLDHVSGHSRRANIPKVNREEFASYSSPVPVIHLQQAFSKIVHTFQRQRTHLTSHLAKVDVFFSSLQQRAFKGEL